MSDLRRQAEELLTLGAVRDAVASEYKKRHTALKHEYEELGLERQRITLPDGTPFGLAVLAAAAVYVEIIDRDMMLDWLEEHRPDEIREKKVYDINPAYWRVLEEAARKAGVGVDPETGQRLDWIRVTIGERTLRVTPTTEAKRMVKELLKANQILPELESPPDEETPPLRAVREPGSDARRPGTG